MKVYTHNGKKNIIWSQVKAARLIGKITLSQQDLSDRLAQLGTILDRTAISRIEAGSRLVMDYELFALSKALKVSVDWLLDSGL